MLSNFFNVYTFFGITIVFVVWFFWLTIFVLKNQRIFNSFLSGSEKKSIQDLINKILIDNKTKEEQIELLKKRFSETQIKNKKNIQKIGLYRFNPFKDTGGDQSFILSLLDEENSGLVISSFFSRTGNRWYVKKVKTGKGVDVELSEEENKTVEIAS